MGDNYYPPDFFKNVTPIIIFDNDTSGIEQSVNLGYNLTTVWSTDPLIINQYRSATDYRGCQLFLIAMGFTQSQADQILTPLPLGSRDLDPAIPQYGIPAPNGAAYAWANWAIQFRRMTNIRLFGQAWEWAGYLNYTKSLPQYQKDLTPGNQFTYYFTNANGGVVYASGFNQEGYVVTPAGLLDLTTGQTVAVENIGNGNLDLPTILNNLTLTGTTTIYDTLDIQANNVTFGVGCLASTTDLGVGTIASIADLTSASAVTTDSALNAAGPRFVTPEGLAYFSANVNLITVNRYLWVGNDSRPGKLTAAQMTDAEVNANSSSTGVFFFTTLQQAVIWLSARRIYFTATVYIKLENGTHTYNSTTTFSHPNGSQVRIEGESGGTKVFDYALIDPAASGNAVPPGAAMTSNDLVTLSASPVQIINGGHGGYNLEITGDLQALLNLALIGLPAGQQCNGLSFNGSPGTTLLSNVVISRHSDGYGLQVYNSSIVFSGLYIYDQYASGAGTYPTGSGVGTQASTSFITFNSIIQGSNLWMRGVGFGFISTNNSDVTVLSLCCIGNDDSGNTGGYSNGKSSTYPVAVGGGSFVAGYTTPAYFVNQSNLNSSTYTGFLAVSGSFQLGNSIYSSPQQLFIHVRSDGGVTKSTRQQQNLMRVLGGGSFYGNNGPVIAYNAGTGPAAFTNADLQYFVAVGTGFSTGGLLDASGVSTSIVLPGGFLDQIVVTLI